MLVSNAEGVIYLELCVCVCTYMFFVCVFRLCVPMCVRWSHTGLISSTSLSPPSISKGASFFVSWSLIPPFCFILTVNEGWEAKEWPSQDGSLRKKKKRERERVENAARHLVVFIDCSQIGDK